MVKPFSGQANRLLSVLAQKEGKLNRSQCLLPEHVILAMIKSGEGLGYQILQSLPINMLELQIELEQVVMQRSVLLTDEVLPNSRRLEDVLRKAEIEAVSLRQSYVGTEHILIAASREEKSVFNKFLTHENISFLNLRTMASSLELKRDGNEGSPRVNRDINFFGELGESVSESMESALKNTSKNPFVKSTEKQEYPSEKNNDVKAKNSPLNEEDDFMNDMSFPFGRPRYKKGATMLETFGCDLVQKAKDGQLDVVIGRNDEINRVIQILARRQKNNPVLLGESGVGKTSIVEGLALRIANETVPACLLDKKLYSLDLASMVAGTRFRGDFEERMKRLINEVKERKNIILFIDELHTLIGAGGPEGSMDASNMLKPALARGQFQCIGATTLKEYTKFFEKDAALERRFQSVLVEEPSILQTVEILEGIAPKYEEYHGVKYENDVFDFIAKNSARYITNRKLPDKAIDVLDEAGAIKKISLTSEANACAILKSRIKKLNEQKDELVKNQEFENAVYVRDSIKNLTLELESLENLQEEVPEKKSNVVTKKDICNVICSMTGIQLDSLDETESVRLLNMENELHKSVIGQDEAIKLISSAIRRSRSGVSSPKRPTGSFIFLGPTGVGKTLLAKSLAKFMFADENSIIRVDMSDFMEKHTVSRLIGAPPGYVGYDEGGFLTEKVRRNPYSVILFDEIEKAHKDVFNLLLQILEEGELSDNLGHVVNFRNTVIIMTSNAGVRQISTENRIGFSTDTSKILEYSQIKNNALSELKKIMNPELLNRIDDIVVFTALSQKEIGQILDLQISELQSRLSEQNLTLKLSKSAREYLVENGYEPNLGARPMRRLIQREIEDGIANLIISGECIPGDEISVGYKNSKFTLKVRKPDVQNEIVLTENIQLETVDIASN